MHEARRLEEQVTEGAEQNAQETNANWVTVARTN